MDKIDFSLKSVSRINLGERPPKSTARSQRISQRLPRRSVVNGRSIVRCPAQLELQERPLDKILRCVIIQHSNNAISLIVHYADGSYERM